MPTRNKRNNVTHRITQPPLPFSPSDDEHLDISTLETWLWDAACAIRGATDAPKFKDFILPLILSKRCPIYLWENHDAYQTAFERQLRDLKVEG